MELPENFTENTIDQFPINFIFDLIGRQHHIALKKELEPYNINVSEYHIIMKLYTEGKKTQQDISRSFYLTEGTVARSIRHLEDKNLIKREIDENNRRRNFVYLTDKSKKLASKIDDLDNQWENTVCNFLTKEDIHNLKQVLYKITINSINTKEKL